MKTIYLWTVLYNHENWNRLNDSYIDMVIKNFLENLLNFLNASFKNDSLKWNSYFLNAVISVFTFSEQTTMPHVKIGRFIVKLCSWQYNFLQLLQFARYLLSYSRSTARLREHFAVTLRHININSYVDTKVSSERYRTGYRTRITIKIVIQSRPN